MITEVKKERENLGDCRNHPGEGQDLGSRKKVNQVLKIIKSMRTMVRNSLGKNRIRMDVN